MASHAHTPPAHGAHDAHATHDPHGLHHHHVTPTIVFVKVLGALLFLTVVTVLIARFDFGSLNMLIAMGVAAVKASLVLTFFMHLKYDTAINNIVILSSFLFLALLFLFTLGDLFTRGLADPRIDKPSPVYSPEGPMIERIWKGPSEEHGGAQK